MPRSFLKDKRRIYRRGRSGSTGPLEKSGSFLAGFHSSNELNLELLANEGCGFDGLCEKLLARFARNRGVNELVWRESYRKKYLEIVFGEGWCRVGIVGGIAAQGENAQGEADLSAAKGGGFGIGEGAKFTGASLNDVAGQLAW